MIHVCKVKPFGECNMSPVSECDAVHTTRVRPEADWEQNCSSESEPDCARAGRVTVSTRKICFQYNAKRPDPESARRTIDESSHKPKRVCRCRGCNKVQSEARKDLSKDSVS